LIEIVFKKKKKKQSECQMLIIDNQESRFGKGNRAHMRAKSAKVNRLQYASMTRKNHQTINLETPMVQID